MSYFLLVNGNVKGISAPAGTSFKPVEGAQEYARNAAKILLQSEHLPHTFLVEDSSGTSDEFVSHSVNCLVYTAFIKTELGQLLSECTDRKIEIFFWWPNSTGSPPPLEKFTDKDQFLESVEQKISKGQDVNSHYSP